VKATTWTEKRRDAVAPAPVIGWPSANVAHAGEAHPGDAEVVVAPQPRPEQLDEVEQRAALGAGVVVAGPHGQQHSTSNSS
jgi:hypothetical protein